MTYTGYVQILIRDRPGTLSAGGLPLLGTPSSTGNEFLELPTQHVAEGETIVLARSVAADMLEYAYQENRSLRQQVHDLEAQMAELRSELGLDRPACRDIPDAQAKREVRAFFRENHGSEIYPDEVAEALNLDLMQVIGICEELEDAGKIVSKA